MSNACEISSTKWNSISPAHINTAKSFNRSVLSASYPDDLLEHIFRGQELFGGEGLTKTRNGFTQKIVKKGKYNIQYSVLNKQILFRDTMNDILIKVKRIDT